MERARHELTGGGLTLWGAEQVESPAEELFFLGGAVATVLAPTHASYDGGVD